MRARAIYGVAGRIWFGDGEELWTSIPEDWPGEAALIGQEMKRFDEWAREKVEAMVRPRSFLPAWNWALYVYDGEYVTAPLRARAASSMRLVWRAP